MRDEAPLAHFDAAKCGPHLELVLWGLMPQDWCDGVLSRWPFGIPAGYRCPRRSCIKLRWPFCYAFDR